MCNTSHNRATLGFLQRTASDICGRRECAACLGIGGSVRDDCASIPIPLSCGTSRRASANWQGHLLRRASQTLPTVQRGEPGGDVSRHTKRTDGRPAQEQGAVGTASLGRGSQSIRRAIPRCSAPMSTLMCVAKPRGMAESKTCAREDGLASVQRELRTSRICTESSGRVERTDLHAPRSFSAKQTDKAPSRTRTQTALRDVPCEPASSRTKRTAFRRASSWPCLGMKSSRTFAQDDSLAEQMASRSVGMVSLHTG